MLLWHPRVMGLLIAATLACTAAHSTRTEPRPADGCKRTAFRVIIDVGHTEQAPGASSARGVSEFTFNVNLARRIEQQLLAAGFRRSVLLITEGPSGKGLAERVTRANALEADLFLSVHHDSVPDEFLEKWEFEGEQATSATVSRAIPFSSPMTTATVPAVCCLPGCWAASCESAD